MSKKLLFLCTILFACSPSWSQTINLDFPYFAGSEYVFCLFNGEKTDTISRGALDERGQSVIVIPPAYDGYTGNARWSLTNGGGMMLVLNNEKNFSVRCTEAIPSDSSIVFIDTPENEFMQNQYMRQSAVLNKARNLQSLLKQYEPTSDIYRLVNTELQGLESDFANIYADMQGSPLYAARIHEYINFLNRTGSRLNLSEQEAETERRQQITERFDLKQLYHSGLWENVIADYISSVAGNDSLLLADSRALLKRAAATDKEVEESLLRKLLLLYSQYGKENLRVDLGVENPVSRGHLAPVLHLADEQIRPVNSLLVFYESGCGHCESEMKQLVLNYPVLKSKGYEVISIAADMDSTIDNNTIRNFPWPTKLCDFKGFGGENFVNYDIMGTPTIFVIDERGIIQGRYARLEDCQIINSY